jgi:hypothetical protein
MKPFLSGASRHCAPAWAALVALGGAGGARGRTMCRRRRHGHEDRHFMSDLGPATSAPAGRSRLLPTFAVAAVIAAVVLGGLGIDSALAAPSAGILDLGGSVSVAAAPGWVLTSPDGTTTSPTQLRKADAILTAQVVEQSYTGDSAALITEAETELDGASAQISFGDAHHRLINGNDTTYVSFQATVTTAARSGVVDGEVIAMVVGGNAVLFELAAPQGRLGSAVDDVSTMLDSVKVGR